jgi:Zn-dependent M28 family amino/carboxypeptidase
MLLLPAVTVEKIFELAGSPPPQMDPAESIQHAPVSISLQVPMTTRTLMAPNVVGRIRGVQETELDAVVLTAHFDHEPPGRPTEEADSILNGSDDNASGTVGLLEAARAFSALPAPPARSVVFAAVSAEEMGLLGSAYLAEHGPAPASSAAAALNMDMLSRNAPDSIFVFGQTYSSLGTVFQDVLESHPELGFRVRPGLQRPDLDLIRFSDQFPFLARGVPVLMFNSGFHPELHTPDDEVELADTDKLARAARLMFFLAWAVADDPEDPVWTEEGRVRTEAIQRRLGR